MNQDGERPETIREWYHRSTRRWRVALVYATLTAFVVAAVMFSVSSVHFLARLQTFNGAFTIPISAFIWILAFVFVFLVPSREVSFRSQESIEKMVEIADRAFVKKLEPAIEQWKKIGEIVQKELDGGLFKDLRDALKEVKDAVARVEQSASNSNGELRKFTEDAKPALETLKKIQGHIEKELGTGFLEKIRDAADAVQELRPMPAKPTEPDLDKALQAVSKKKAAQKSAGTPVPVAALPEEPVPERNRS